MSLILDALSRAERERRANDQPVPDLLTPAASVNVGRRRALPWLLALLLLPGLGLLLWWGMSGPQRPDLARTSNEVANPGRVAPRASRAAPGAAPPGQAPPGPAPAVRDLPVTAKPGASLSRNSDRSAERAAPNAGRRGDSEPQRAAIAALYAGSGADTATDADGDSRAAGPRAGAAPRRRGEEAKDTGAGAGPQDRAAAAGSAPAGDVTAPVAGPAAAGHSGNVAQRDAPTPVDGEETDIDLEALLERVQEEQANATLLPHAAPMLSATSQRFRDRVPTLMYLRHDYRRDGASSVVLNGRRLAAGEQTDGVRVLEILRDSVVLRFDGEDFRLKALSSWVNL